MARRPKEATFFEFLMKNAKFKKFGLENVKNGTLRQSRIWFSSLHTDGLGLGWTGSSVFLVEISQSKSRAASQRPKHCFSLFNAYNFNLSLYIYVSTNLINADIKWNVMNWRIHFYGLVSLLACFSTNSGTSAEKMLTERCNKDFLTENFKAIQQHLASNVPNFPPMSDICTLNEARWRQISIWK